MENDNFDDEGAEPGDVASYPDGRGAVLQRKGVFLALVAGVTVLAGVLVAVCVARPIGARRSRQDAPPFKDHLEFRMQDGTATFKILQIADIHTGENSWEAWGPEQDRKTWNVLDTVISLEEPDILILSGDQLTANNVKSNATAYYQILGERLSQYGIPWAVICGNHDDMAYLDPQTGQVSPAQHNCSDLLAIDQEFPLSHTMIGPAGIFGSSNYILEVFLNDAPALQIYMLDSGGGALPQKISQSQIDWLLEEINPSLPAVAFQHIPTKEFGYNDDCYGFHGENGVAPLESGDAGIVDTLSQLGNVAFLAVGHQVGCPRKE